MERAVGTDDTKRRIIPKHSPKYWKIGFIGCRLHIRAQERLTFTAKAGDFRRKVGKYCYRGKGYELRQGLIEHDFGEFFKAECIRTSQVRAAPLSFRLRKYTIDIDLTTSHSGESDD